MSKATHALAGVAGCAFGFAVFAVMYSTCFFNTCVNIREDGSFECSRCGSNTDYKPYRAFNFCPMCGAFVMRERYV